MADKWYSPHHSAEELYFSWWCDDMEDLIIDKVFQPDSYILAKPVTYELENKKGTTDTKNLEQGHVYTPDARLILKPEARPFFNIMGEPTTKERKNLPWLMERSDGFEFMVEVKPSGYDPHNMLRLAKINQKWVYEKYGVLVNICRIGNAAKTFFDHTFCPQRYIKCDKNTDRDRKIHFDIKSKDSFLS